MKKLTLILTLLFSNVALADRIEFMPTSTLKGPQGNIIRMITEQAKAADIELVPAQKNGCGEAVNVFNTSKNPIAIIWSDTNIRTGQRIKQDCVIDFKSSTPILVTSSTYEFCTLADKKLSKTAVNNFGVIRTRPTNELLRLMNSNKQGYKFKNVLYKSSGSVLQAILNREVDMGMLSTGKAQSAIKKGTIKCHYTTGATSFGQEPVSKFFGEASPLSEIRLGMMMFVRNFTPEQIKRLEKSLDDKFVFSLDNSNLFGTKVGIDADTQKEFVRIAENKANYK